MFFFLFATCAEQVENFFTNFFQLQAKIDETCPTFDCNDIEADSLDCTLEERPGRPDFSSMTDAEIEAFKAEMMAKKEEKKEQIMNCACCAGYTAEELLGGVN